jgi:hypothetical protein
VERYQDVYPTKQQTGTELFQLVHVAAQSFSRVALYFENSILTPDLPLLASAAASVDKAEQNGSRLVIESHNGVGVPWQGPALVNGRLWPVHSDDALAAGRTQCHRTRAQRLGAPDGRFQRRLALSQRGYGWPAIHLWEQCAGLGAVERAAQ